MAIAIVFISGFLVERKLRIKVMKEITIAILLGVFLICAAIWHKDAEENAISNWAEENKCQIIEQTAPMFDTGPYWMNDDEDAIYRLIVKKRDGEQKIVWLRVGDHLFADKVEADWDYGK